MTQSGHSPNGSYGTCGRSSRSDWRDARKLYDLAPLLSSSARSLPKSAGEPGSVEAPSSANRVCDLGSARTAFTALLTLLMASPSVLFGAPKPYHALAS